ncbi:hypothetical protein OH738_13625 [Streptomyces hirsutus]|uniref:Uncharacterized protein n=1 Tax=Streptomyces hirsutus TaxID=35620 RepID=A0ABZ1GUC1_9ACTN|nr:hypothetical protein OIE73_25805 [Streptomyces hirsutus]WTD17734.1 hypothetical protein OH738_13625 [Streptomyces hirsutus]
MTSHSAGGDGDGGCRSAAEQTHRRCARCGATAEGPLPPRTLSAESGARRHPCGASSLEHLRAIEGRLDAQWW